MDFYEKLPKDIKNKIKDNHFGSKKYWKNIYNEVIIMVNSFNGIPPFQDSWVYLDFDRPWGKSERSSIRKRLNRACITYFNFSHLKSFIPNKHFEMLPNIYDKNNRLHIKCYIKIIRVIRLTMFKVKLNLLIKSNPSEEYKYNNMLNIIEKNLN
jgi:hypothetical protein